MPIDNPIYDAIYKNLLESQRAAKHLKRLISAFEQNGFVAKPDLEPDADDTYDYPTAEDLFYRRYVEDKFRHIEDMKRAIAQKEAEQSIKDAELADKDAEIAELKRRLEIR